MFAFVELSSEAERALRQLGSQSISITPKAARLLVRLALAEPYRDGWRLTPLGLQRYQSLPKPLLQGRRSPRVIDKILDRAIPAAQAAGISPPTRSPANREISIEASACRADPKTDEQKALTSRPLFGTDAMSTRMAEETRQRLHNSRVLLEKTAGIVRSARRDKQSD